MKFGSVGKRARVALVSAATAIVLVSASPGHAGDDAGIGAFFRQQFGIGAAEAPAVSGSVDERPEARPVIIRPHRKRMVARRTEVKIAVGPVAPVSIYEDQTLRAGDAVMTAKGIRVFMGGHGAPYTEANFAALAEADRLPRQVEKALLVIDKAPRS